LFETFVQDARRWVVPGRVYGGRLSLPRIAILMFRHLPLRAMAWFRVASWFKRRRIPYLPGAIQRSLLKTYGLEIMSGADIEGGLYIAHPVGTVIMVRHMGRNCSVIAAATIGMRNTWEFPDIGDNVFIGAGARVLGGIRVGSNASIGAGAVVVSDVADRATVVGVPARPLGTARSESHEK
jgi:serine O-acetyltransferase